MRKALVWTVVAVVSLTLVLVLNSYGKIERGYSAIGGEVMIPAIPLVGAAIIAAERNRKVPLPPGQALYLAKVGSGWIQSDGTELSSEDETGFTQRCQDEVGFLGDFISRMDWQILMITPQECINNAAEKGIPVYIISPGKLSKCDGHTFAFGLDSIKEGDSVFYMKAKGVTAGEGDSWGGVKTAVRLDAGVISQETALAQFGKGKLLEIMGLGKYANDIEFITEEEYNRDFAHNA